jgi:hypothetical protein
MKLVHFPLLGNLPQDWVNKRSHLHHGKNQCWPIVGCKKIFSFGYGNTQKWNYEFGFKFGYLKKIKKWFQCNHKKKHYTKPTNIITCFV